MKLRYQMRGLGIGIVVTALLMGVATKDSRPMTDAEIKAKAYTLGMVDSDSLSLADLQGGTAGPNSPAPQASLPPQETVAPKETETPQETVAPKETETPQETMVPERTSPPEVTVMPEETLAPSIAPTVEPAPDSSMNEPVAIVIRQGANSYTVSVQLADAGLVEDALEYDRYLCSNGYADRIHTGTYYITPGADAEQIAQMIAGGR